MTDHLGDLAAALVDGQLDHATRDRVLAHLARCTPCRRAVEEERAAKAALTALRQLPPSAELTSRLVRLAAADPALVPAPPAGAPAAPGRPGAGRVPSGWPGARWGGTRSDQVRTGRLRAGSLGAAPAGFGPGALPAEVAAGLAAPRPAPAGYLVRPVPARGRRRRMALAGALAAGVAFSSMLALGDTGAAPSAPGPAVDPASVSFVQQHAATTGQLPMDDPGLAVLVSTASR